MEVQKATDQYIELFHKASLFAEMCEYDTCFVGGHFSFYNSPCHRSFKFTVDPATYKSNPSSTILSAFFGR